MPVTPLPSFQVPGGTIVRTCNGVSALAHPAVLPPDDPGTPRERGDHHEQAKNMDAAADGLRFVQQPEIAEHVDEIMSAVIAGAAREQDVLRVEGVVDIRRHI